MSTTAITIIIVSLFIATDYIWIVHPLEHKKDPPSAHDQGAVGQYTSDGSTQEEDPKSFHQSNDEIGIVTTDTKDHFASVGAIQRAVELGERTHLVTIHSGDDITTL